MTAQSPLLNEQAIRDQLNNSLQALPLRIFTSVDSTNRVLKESLGATNEICCAETQTAGRGRFGRSWYSPIAENIYCSSRWHLDRNEVSGLSLVVSLAICATLRDFGLANDIRIKWPNDIVWQDKKLCGNLIEIITKNTDSMDVVIGIGLNVNSNTKEATAQTMSWCSLYDITGRYTDRNVLIAKMINQLHEHLIEWMKHGLSVFLAAWNDVDYLKNRFITVSQPNGTISGIEQGINEIGQLLVIYTAGNEYALSSGEASLHAINS